MTANGWLQFVAFFAVLLLLMRPLGLYIAREVCEANDAKLEFIETPAGAQFTVLCQGVVRR